MGRKIMVKGRGCKSVRSVKEQLYKDSSEINAAASVKQVEPNFSLPRVHDATRSWRRRRRRRRHVVAKRRGKNQINGDG